MSDAPGLGAEREEHTLSEEEGGPTVDAPPLPSGGWEELFEASPIATGLAVGFCYVRANRALGDLLGLAPEAVVGRDPRDFLGDAMLADLEVSLAAVGRGERRIHLEGALRRDDGRDRWASIDAVLVEGADPGDGITLVKATDLTDLHEARTRLVASERRFRRLLGNISDTVSVTEADGSLVSTTGRQSRALGYPAAFWEDVHPLDLVHPDDRERARTGWADALERPGVEISSEVRMRTAGGSWADVVVTGVNLLADPDVRGIVVTTRNITAIRRAERLSTSQAAVLELIARGAPLADVLERCVELVEANGVGGRSSIYLLDGDRLEMRAGRAPAELNDLLRDPPRRPDRSVCDLAVATGAAAVVHDLEQAALDVRLVELGRSLGLRAAWSLPIVDTGGRVLGSLSTIYQAPHTPNRHERQVGEVAANLVSIALERVATEERLAHQAMHDGLTGLPNRTLLLDRLEHALARRARSGTHIAVLFCDLDRFKVVNDSLGHGIGDQLLVAVAERLRRTIDAGDTVARFGGDEFVVLVEDAGDPDGALRVAERIGAALERPFLLPAGQEVYLTASIGVARANDHGTADGWLRDADAAMYRAKERGRNRLELFDTDMREAAMSRLQIENDLRRAVDRDELEVHYQPIVDLRTGRIRGAEALVRWRHPRRGLLPPDDFIEVAEETGTIDAIGHHVLDRAVRDVSTVVERLGVTHFQLGVNLSARQLTTPGLVQDVVAVCERYAWPHGSLLLEITETALTRGVEEPLDVLHRIHDLGVQLAIDDFGTGHSSMTRLGRMPVGQVKVDKSFVAAIDQGGDRFARIIEAVVAVAGALDLTTSAEGVESQSQLDFLRRSRCHLAQGYFFSKPLPIDDLEALLAADPRW